MKIPVYDQQIVPTQGMGNTRLVAEQSGSGMAQIGEGLQGLAVALDNREKVKAQAWFSQASSKADLDLNQIYNNQTKTAQPGAEGFGKTYLEAFDKYKADAVANAPAHAKPLMEAHLARTREAYGLQAMRFENEEGYRYMGQQFDEGVSASSKLVSATPELFEREMGKFASTAAQMAATPEQRAALNEMARKNLAWNAVTGEIDRNPGADEFTGKAWDLLTADEQDRAKTYAKQKKNEFKAQKQASAFISIAGDVMKAPPMLGSGVVDLPKAKAAAQKQASSLSLDPEQSLALDSYIEKAAGDYERDYRRKVDASKANLFDQLEENGGDYQALLVKYPWIQNMAPEFRDDVNKFAGMVATGGSVETDWQAYLALERNPKLLVDTNLDAMRNTINSNELNHLRTLKDKLLKGVPEQNLLGNAALVKRLATEAGYTNDKDQGEISSLIQSAIDNERTITGKELTQKRIEELTKESVMKKIKEDYYLGFIDKEMPSAFDLLKDADPEDMAKIDAELARRGMEQTDINRARMLKDIQESSQ